MRYCPSCGTRFSGEVRFCPHDGQPLAEREDDTTETSIDPLIGQVIDNRYRVEEVIGEGGMGVVYRAVHEALNKPFALKVLHGDMARDANVVQRFVQEAQSSSAIGHPNIIDISDFGRLPDGAAYFVMEYLEGESLADRMSRGQLSVEESVDIAEQVASALAAAHARGIVHRDLKPDNVFLISRGGSPRFVKVLDFGIAKVGGANSKLTKTGMVFGTPHYMSPEQAAGQSVDERADVYALGVILFEMLVGEVPYDADTFMGILSKHMFDPVPLLDSGREAGRFQGVIANALAKKPEDRYGSMEAFRADLHAVHEGVFVAGPEPETLAPGTLSGEAVEAARAAMSAERESEPVVLPGRRPPLFAVGVVLGLFGLLGVGAAVALKSEGEPATAVSVGNAPSEHGATTMGAPETAAGMEEAAGMSAAATMEAEPPHDGVDTMSTADAATPEELALIEIESEPSGAEVYLEGALVGTTPTRLPRPAGTERTTVELRAEGYEPRAIGLFSYSPPSIQASLDRRARVRTGMRTSMHSSPPSEPPVMTEAPPQTTPTPPVVPTTRRRSSEVLNPWD